MEDLELYISLAGTILGLLITTFTFLSKFIKNAKAKKVAQELIKITQEIIPFIEEAETFIHYTGTEKKAYVMTKATQFVINNKMKVEPEKISNAIEELVSLTKKVNTTSTRSSKELKKLYE